MLEIIKPGLETSIQDFPGRIGYWNQGFPPAGPMDSWACRLANILVGNDAGAAGLEAQFVGDDLREHLATEYPLAFFLGAATPEQVDFDRFQVQEIQDGVAAFGQEQLR